MKIKEVMAELRKARHDDVVIIGERLPGGGRQTLYVTDVWNGVFIHVPHSPFFLNVRMAADNIMYDLTDMEQEVLAAIATRQQNKVEPYNICVRYRVVSMDGCLMECERIKE